MGFGLYRRRAAAFPARGRAAPHAAAVFESTKDCHAVFGVVARLDNKLDLAIEDVKQGEFFSGLNLSGRRGNDR